MTDIREQAAKAAREWKERSGYTDAPTTRLRVALYERAWTEGYEAAKAEAFECPGDTRTCPSRNRGECKGTEAEWNDESCESRVNHDY